MDDELSKRRNKPKAPAVSVNEMYPQGKDDDTPTLNMWLMAQTHHSDPVCAEAARAARERWDLNWTVAAKIERSWAAEDSEYLIGFRKLLNEYREIFAEDDKKTMQSFIRQTSSAVTLLPVHIEYCSKCNRREAIPGTGLCARDGGQWLTEAQRSQIAQQVADTMLELQMRASRTLSDLMDNAGSEMVRMQAAIAVFDRTGKGAQVNLNHSGTIGLEASERAAEILSQRLEKLAPAMHHDPEQAAIEGDIVDAEVV